MISVLFLLSTRRKVNRSKYKWEFLFVSIENARLNLDTEQSGKNFSQVLADARMRWNEDLSRILVEGGTEEQKTVFYTALYHTLIHPNILQDVNGQYPAMESNEILTTNGGRYTVFLALGYVP